ncbi:hypothetical protein [Microbacterium sp. NPDC087592]|uniref:hypothetical protein n=1 Tax=Microbacterium sp. NPDC087592 TaxID=3364193 RepID=UPI003810BFCC
MSRTLTRRWHDFALARPTWSQLIIFSALNVGMTVLQLVMMPLVRIWLGTTTLEDVTFRALPLGDYFIFDYPAGPIPEGGGGLAYFLAVQITLAVAQILNFFAQRNITFKSNSNPWWAAFWYLIAFVVITFGAAAFQGLYKGPIYSLFITSWGMGAAGEATADAVTMLINALISCAVFFPIFKLIFRREDAVVVVPAREYSIVS